MFVVVVVVVVFGASFSLGLAREVPIAALISARGHDPFVRGHTLAAFRIEQRSMATILAGVARVARCGAGGGSTTLASRTGTPASRGG